MTNQKQISVSMTFPEWISYCKKLLKKIEELANQNSAFIDTQLGQISTPLNKILTNNLAKELYWPKPDNREKFNVFISIAKQFLDLF